MVIAAQILMRIIMVQFDDNVFNRTRNRCTELSVEDLRFGSAIFENLELNFRFSSGRFGFDPKFRTELVHH